VKAVQVFDRPLCCSTGVCGPDVDPVLPRFAADLDWLRAQGHRVDRYNLAQEPDQFVQHKAVLDEVAALGAHCLPIVVVDGVIVSRRDYPTRERLAAWTGSSLLSVITDPSRGCCGPSDCCG